MDWLFSNLFPRVQRLSGGPVGKLVGLDVRVDSEPTMARCYWGTTSDGLFFTDEYFSYLKFC